MFEKLWRNSRTVLVVSEERPDAILDAPFLHQPDIRLLSSYPDDHALELARRKHPSLIIEELHPPDRAGSNFRQQLRKDPRTRSIPLILVTDDRSREHVDGEADMLLCKPLHRMQLFDAVRRFVAFPDRRHLRYGTNLRFTFTAEGQSGQAFSRDLSTGGAFLKTDRVLPLGARMDLAFRLPGAWEEIRCRAVVVRSTSENDPHSCQSSGFAIEFQELTDDDAGRLDAFIDQHLGRRSHGF